MYHRWFQFVSWSKPNDFFLVVASRKHKGRAPPMEKCETPAFDGFNVYLVRSFRLIVLRQYFLRCIPTGCFTI